jgi:hypothetical protein
MPLMRGRILGYDANRMAFQFTMLNDKGETVECEISSAAMDELAGKKGTLPAEREPQFLRLRESIERIASDNFDSASVVRGAVVRIFAKHNRSWLAQARPAQTAAEFALASLFSLKNKLPDGWGVSNPSHRASAAA